MFPHTLEEIAKTTGGLLVRGTPETKVQCAFTDSRVPKNIGLFVAIEGEAFDGHDFLEEALRGGAAAVLVSRAGMLWPESQHSGAGAVLVAETRQAYMRLAAAHRTRLDDLVWFAVTGSAGKSTVKEMLAHILAAGAGVRVHRALGSFNNEIGVPATILGAAPEDRAVVLELGTNHPGEIARLAWVARPHVAVITNAGPVHLEALKSVEGVAEEKASILDAQERRGVSVLPACDPFLDLWRARARGHVLTFGLNKRGDVHGEALVPCAGGGWRFVLRHGARRTQVRLSLPGRHNVLNALAASAAALAAGVEPEAIAAALASFSGVSRRFQSLDAGGVTVIDDAYNASPLSFDAALESLRVPGAPGALGGKARRCFIVAGDMLELGAEAEYLHRELGAALAHAEPQALLTLGPWMEYAGRAAVEAGLPPGAWISCATPEEAAERIEPLLRPGDVVLVKGSHGMRLDRCVALLRAHAENFGAPAFRMGAAVAVS